MGTQLVGHRLRRGAYFATFIDSAGKWLGCDWPTTFGVNELQLKNLRPTQAKMLAEATAGSESSDWRRAAEWLNRVESDANHAEAKAAKAAELAETGRLIDALKLAEESCDIERQYHSSLIWKPLCEAIAAALADQQSEEGKP
jgi:hypothetical protein